MRCAIYVFIIISGFVLAILSIRAQRQGTIRIISDDKKKRDIFEVIARYIYDIVCVRIFSKFLRGSIFEIIFYAPQVKKDLRALKPDAKVEVLQSEYYVQKIRKFLLFFYIGDVLALCIYISNLGAGEIYDNRYIDRNTYDHGQKQIAVQVETEDGHYEDQIQLSVDAIVYDERELNEMYQRAVSELETLILGNNLSKDKISESLVLPASLEGYPFELEWESNNYFYLNHQGKIQQKELDPEGEKVVLTCHFNYMDWSKDYLIDLTIVPGEKSMDEKWRDNVESAVAKAQEQQKYNNTYILPEEIDGRLLKWTEIKEDYSLVLLVLMMFASCCIYMFSDRDLHQKVQEREKQMLAEYPVLINRLTLYLGAGMTIKGAWNKIAGDYSKLKAEGNGINYTYEEMLFTSYEMQCGVSEHSAYERFGKRCGLQPYTKLSGLLNQSMKKGNSMLVSDLQAEAENAQELRRNMARRKGEEAGTKLLVPMMMMLGIVMVFVMVPAFLSFST